MLLIEIDQTVENSTLVNHLPGVWKKQFTPGIGFTDDFGNPYTYGRDTEFKTRVESVAAGGGLLIKETSISNVIANNNTFYFEQGTQILYVHFADSNPPGALGFINIGAVVGYSDTIDTITGNVYSEVPYPVRIEKVPSISGDKDPLFFGYLNFMGGSVSLFNADGEFDSFPDLPVYAQPARILQIEDGETDIANAETIFSGQVGAFSNNLERLTLKIDDKRQRLTQPMPANFYDSTEVQDQKEAGKVKPIGFGTILNGSTVQIGSTEFRFCDNSVVTPVSIDQVYVDDALTAHTGTASDGTFTISGYTDGKVTVDWTGPDLNGLEVIEFLNNQYADVAYSSTTYNTGEWEAEKLNAAKIGVLYDKEIKLNKAIEQICVDLQGIFIVDRDGRFTFRTFSTERLPVAKLRIDTNLNLASIEWPNDEFLSSCKVEYSKDYNFNNYSIVNNVAFESEVFSNYKNKRSRTFTTNLQSAGDAAEYSTNIMQISKDIVPTVKIEVTDFEEFRLKLGDFFHCEFNRPDGSGLQDAVYELIGYDYDPQARRKNLILRYVKDLPEGTIGQGGTTDAAVDIVDGGTLTDNYDIIDGGTI